MKKSKTVKSLMLLAGLSLLLASSVGLAAAEKKKHRHTDESRVTEPSSGDPKSKHAHRDIQSVHEMSCGCSLKDAIFHLVRGANAGVSVLVNDVAGAKTGFGLNAETKFGVNNSYGTPNQLGFGARGIYSAGSSRTADGATTISTTNLVALPYLTYTVNNFGLRRLENSVVAGLGYKYSLVKVTSDQPQTATQNPSGIVYELLLNSKYRFSQRLSAGVALGISLGNLRLGLNYHF